MGISSENKEILFSKNQWDHLVILIKLPKKLNDLFATRRRFMKKKKKYWIYACVYLLERDFMYTFNLFFWLECAI